MKSNRLLYGLLLLCFGLAGCGEESAATNAAPTLTGVKDIQCVVNSTVDFLDGIAALDREDGDITPNLSIAITPSVQVKDGLATFERPGEYRVEYRIEDSGGRSTTKHSYVDVVSRDQYVDFAMPIGFTSTHSRNTAFETCGMVNGEFVVKAKGGEVAEDALIHRAFTLDTNTPYTFHFSIDSNCSGKAKAFANGVECGELAIEKGESVLSFNHTFVSEKDQKEEVDVALGLGAIEKLDLKITKVEVEYPQEAGARINHTEGFRFKGNIEPRIENGCEGNCWTVDNDETAVFEIKKAIPEIWLGGMFVNTGVNLKSGCTYEVSFDLWEMNEENYEVIIQTHQWDEIVLEKIYNPKNGSYSRTITITDETKGPLWLYVQSGTAVNEIRMKNLKVVEILNATGKDEFPIQDFEERHGAAYPCTFSSRLGNFHYRIEKFSAIDGDIKVTTPTFYVSGSGANYVLSFKGKASKPIEVIVAAPVAGGWTPTLTWNRVIFDETERVYTFFFNGDGSDRDYTVVWQFGAANNQKYENVEVDVTGVSITLRNRELDG